MDKVDLLKKNNNLTNYYYFSKNLNDEDIEKIINISKKYNKVDGNVSGHINYDYRKSKITWLPLNDDTNFIYDKIINLLKNANNNMWNFNITNLFEDLQLSEYNDNSNGEVSGHYDWHMDFGENNSTRKISVTVQLTDENDYEGRDLEFMINRSIIKAPREKGTVIFFPSYITHRVTKVTKKSLVYWFHGPPFL